MMCSFIDRKHQQLSTINKFAVRNDTVSSVGENLREVIGHMIEADLQDNLLWQWSEVRSYIIYFDFSIFLANLIFVVDSGCEFRFRNAAIAEFAVARQQNGTYDFLHRTISP